MHAVKARNGRLVQKFEISNGASKAFEQFKGFRSSRAKFLLSAVEQMNCKASSLKVMFDMLCRKV
jgi:hypothetical protein